MADATTAARQRIDRALAALERKVLDLKARSAASATVSDDDRFGFVSSGQRTPVAVGDVWRPGTVVEAERGLSVGVGDVDVDLLDVPLRDGVVEVPIDMGAGGLRIVVPDGVAVTAEVNLTAGSIQWDVDGGTRVEGFGRDRTQLFASDEAADGDVELALKITAGAGEVRVVEEDR